MAGADRTLCPRVLSVQSAVCHGYVGNRAATFPLQLLGFEVDVINSVQFSNHTGYSKVKGQRLDGEALRDLVNGLEENGILADFCGRGDGGYTHLLTGYIGNKTFLQVVLTLLDKMQAAVGPDRLVQYVCDPVMGDEGKLYVPEDLVEVYVKEVLPRAHVLTPNQFEVETLLGLEVGSITDLNQALHATEKLHAMGPAMVVITTLDACGSEDMVAMLMSQQDSPVKWMLRLPRVSGGPFTGTGDLTAAMLLAWCQVHGSEPALALEKTGAVLQEVLHRTVHASSGNAARIQANGHRVSPELCLVQSKVAIEKPIASFCCRAVWSRRASGQDALQPLRALVIDNVNVDSLCGVFGPSGAAGDGKSGSRVAALQAHLREKSTEIAIAVLMPGVADAEAGLASLRERSAQQPVLLKQEEVFGAAELSKVGSGISPIIQHCCQSWSIPVDEVLLLSSSPDSLRAGREAKCQTCALLGHIEDSSLAGTACCTASSLTSVIERIF